MINDIIEKWLEPQLPSVKILAFWCAIFLVSLLAAIVPLIFDLELSINTNDWYGFACTLGVFSGIVGIMYWASCSSPLLDGAVPDDLLNLIAENTDIPATIKAELVLILKNKGSVTFSDLSALHNQLQHKLQIEKVVASTTFQKLEEASH